MPALSIWFIRTALIYLLIGWTIGATLLCAKGIKLPVILWLLRPVHIELMLTGWLIQLIMGVAFWMLPRFPDSRSRGNIYPIILAYLALNISIALTIFDQLLKFQQVTLLFPAHTIAQILKLSAILIFIGHTWPRVRAFGNVIR